MLGIAFALPIVQTRVAQYTTLILKEKLGSNIAIDEIAISVFGGVKIKKVLIRDHHNDTLIYANRIKTNILDGKKLLDGNLIFGDLDLDGLVFNLKTYKNEKSSNLTVFVDSFGSDESTEPSTFVLTTQTTKITKSHFRIIDENSVGDSKYVDFSNLNFQTSNFKLKGSDIDTSIKEMSFFDHSGVYIKELNTKFIFTDKEMKFSKLDLSTEEKSRIKGNISIKYKWEELSDFINKAKFDAKLVSTSVASNDIRFFYKELGKDNFFYFKTHIKGALNDLKIDRLNLIDSDKNRIVGNVYLKNIFEGGDKFYLNASFTKLTSSYGGLVSLLPNVLGKTLPTSLKKLQEINLKGQVQLTSKKIAANLEAITSLGKAKSHFVIDSPHAFENASYAGNVALDDFDFGTFLDNKDLGKISLNLDIDGKGFARKVLNTMAKGTIQKVDYRKYQYKNIQIAGNFRESIYEGKVAIDDPNLAMTFDGIIDMTKKDAEFDFHISVANSDLHKLQLVKDTTSLLKGDIVVKISGNTIDDLQGDISVNKVSYQNSKATYNFDDFVLSSSFDKDNIRTISLDSPEIIRGRIEGRYKFNQLQKLVENALGSLYTNYKPNAVDKNQFLKFDLSISNKIVEVFYPEISISKNTVLKGIINSDKNELKLNFNAAQMVAFKNTFDNIRIKIDNKNPLYNTSLELDSIKTAHYKIRDFNAINVTMKDSLFLHMEFKGGNKGDDNYNLNLYHTINADNKNVIGINKSEVKFKDYLWYLNEKNTSDNRIIFDKNINEVEIEDIVLSHENQKIQLYGELAGKTEKDLKLKFNDVNLNKITPENSLFVFNGDLNGEFQLKQENSVYKPTVSLTVNRLNLNKIDLGTLDFSLEGDDKFSKFIVNSSIQDNGVETLNASGNLEIKDNETAFDLGLKLEQFKLATLSPTGVGVLTDMRGLVSGNITIQGNATKPQINGRLYVNKAGIKIPFMGADFELADKTIIDLTHEKILFRNNVLTDTKYGTKGVLNGTLYHKKFMDWNLDLIINSKRLLALNTSDSEDAAYFGTAFINGTATIKGPTDALIIKVVAKSEKGTSVKIPINNSESVSDNPFIHFITLKEKNKIKDKLSKTEKTYKGVELEFDFDITPDAEVEVILDRVSGHGMKGKGNGSLLFKINTLGKFNMWGDFQAYEGIYNFKTPYALTKKFEVKKGGSISWEGNPLKAQLNLEAVYKTIANPSLLIDNSSFNKKVPVEILIGIKGDLMSPEPEFNIEFPTVTNVLKSEIQTKLYDKEIRETQALYLLSTGSFLSTEGKNLSDFSGSLYETASSLLGNVIKSKSDKFDIGFNLVGSDRRVGRETDGRVETSILYKLNDKVTVNGRFGVPFGGITQTAFIGNVEILYRMNEEGTLSLKVFNKENDVTFAGQNIGYTQGTGILYEVDFSTFNEFTHKIFRNNHVKQKISAEYLHQDSEIDPEYLNQSNPNKTKNEELKINKEAIIPEED